MKNIIPFITLLCLTVFGSAQEVNETFSKGAGDAITIKADYPGIEILRGTGSNVRVEGSLIINGIPAPKAMDIKWNKASNTLTVETDIEYAEDMTSEEWEAYVEKLDCDSLKRLYVHNNYGRYGNWNFDGDIRVYVPVSFQITKVRSTYGSIDMQYLSPQVDVFNTYGSINARLDNRVDDIDLTSTYSKVTLEIPSGSDSDVRMESHYGELLSNLDLDIDSNKSVHKQFKNIIYGKLNSGGGTQVKLRSDYGDVILKKI